MAISKECTGSHRFFVAESGVVEAEGTVSIVLACLSCGDSKLITYKVDGTKLDKKDK